jgi:hypothetical protein
MPYRPCTLPYLKAPCRHGSYLLPLSRTASQRVSVARHQHIRRLRRPRHPTRSHHHCHPLTRNRGSQRKGRDECARSFRLVSGVSLSFFLCMNCCPTIAVWRWYLQARATCCLACCPPCPQGCVSVVDFLDLNAITVAMEMYPTDGKVQVCLVEWVPFCCIGVKHCRVVRAYHQGCYFVMRMCVSTC